MKAIIFAGGVGRRLWPLSREKSPKQFEQIIGNKSMLQLAVKRLQPTIQIQDIIISTEVSNVTWRTILFSNPSIVLDSY